MFFEGTLQEGISTAVGQQKLVLCFVTDEEDEGQQWENDFLRDESLSELISKQAVALRLIAGSEEAGYLSQIFPLPQTPTIVLIKNGDLKEYITPGTSRDEFLRRLQAAFEGPARTSDSPATPSAQSSSNATPSTDSSARQTPPQEQRSSNVQRILAERAARLQAQKAEAERKAKEDRVKAKEKAKAEAEAGVKSDAARTHKQQELVKKKRQQEQEERKRILQRIEDDKEERRLRAGEREKMRREGQKTGDVAAALVQAPESKMPSTTRTGEMTALQVRLFDGSTLRSRFKTSSTVKDLRAWVDENRGDGKEPYRFKQVLTPLPNRDIDDTEEDKNLGDLGLAPSSTLVMVPVQNFTSAYEGGSGGGLFASVYGMIFGLFTWLLSLFGIGGERVRRREAASAEASQDDERVRMREVQESAVRRRNQQLYNGNSTNFEPRPDEEEK